MVIAALAAAAVLIASLSTAVALRAGPDQAPDPAAARPPTGAGQPVPGTPTPATDSTLRAAVEGYYGLLPTDPAAAWTRMTERAHTQLGSVDAFAGFWRGFGAVRLVSTVVSTAARTVYARIVLRGTDGQTRTVDQRLELAPGPDNRWLIDNFGH